MTDVVRIERGYDAWLPGSRVMRVGPGASVGSFPLGGELERASAGESQAPDPAWIASIANALFSGLPGESVTGPGASSPSVPAFAVDALSAQVPGAPNTAPPAPSITPMPGQAACQGRAPQGRRRRCTRRAIDNSGSADTGTSRSAKWREGTSGPYMLAPPVSVGSVSDFPVGSPQPAFVSEADLASLPSSSAAPCRSYRLSTAAFPMPDPERACLRRPSTPPSRFTHKHRACRRLAEPQVSAPVFSVQPLTFAGSSFQPLTFAGSPTVAGLVQPHGEKGGEAWPQNEAAPYSRETVASPGLWAAPPARSFITSSMKA